MINKEKLINSPGYFGDSVDNLSIPGMIYFDDNNLLVKITFTDIASFPISNKFKMYGSVNNNRMVFVGCMIVGRTYTLNNFTYIVEPDSVLFGDDFLFCDTIGRIDFYLDELLAHFPSLISSNDTKDGYLLSFQEKKYEFSDSLICFSHFCSCLESTHELMVKERIRCTISFIDSCVLSDALRHMSRLQRYFSVFADRELNIYEVFVFEGNNRYELYLNYFYANSNERKLQPFLVNPPIIDEKFNIQYSKWMQIYDEIQPVMQLVKDIFVDDSIRQNKFLNICQCIEIIEDKYRKEEVKDLFLRKVKDGTLKKEPTFKTKLMDAINLTILQDEAKTIKLSEYIKKARNYYTHYDNRFTQSYEKLGMLITIVRIILLKLLFINIGVEEKVLCEEIHDSYYQNINKIIEDVLFLDSDI